MICLVSLSMGSGCAYAPQSPWAAPEMPISPGWQNPAPISGVQRDVLWEVLVDVVDDYFEVREEVRVRQAGQVVTEGYLRTDFLVGATIFEPHLADSVGSYNRWESTLQSIRRHALVRVMPAEGAFLVEVNVFKEVENVPRPEHATAGAASFAGASRLSPQFQTEPISPERMAAAMTGGWIPRGRDPPLEQCILAELHARLGLSPAAAPESVYPGF